MNNLIGAAQIVMGDGQRLSGNLKTAIRHYVDAAKYYQFDDDSVGVSTCYLSLGGTYHVLGDYDKSIEYYKRSIDIYLSLNDTLRLASAYLNISESYRKEMNIDSAIIYLDEAKSFYDKINYTIGSAYALGNKGLIYKNINESSLAVKYLSEAILLLKEVGDSYSISYFSVELSHVLAEQGHFREAIELDIEALKLARKEGLKEQIRDASLQLSELYSSQSNFKKAHYFQSQYITYRDSINNEETVRKMADLRTEFEVGLKQAEVDLKQKEVDLLQKEAYISRVLLAAGGVFVILLLVVVVVLWQLYHMKVRAANVVRRKRQVIEGQHRRVLQLNATKDRFFSIISHDLRGPISNFSGVAGLIQLYIEDGDYVELKRIGRILENSSHELSTLLDNLLDWAMNQQGVFPYDPEEVSAEEICNPTLRVLSNSANAKNITMTEEVHSEYMVHVDVNSATTTIRNLVSNALKFTPEGGTVTLTVEREGDYAVFVVEDNGIGIPEDKMKNLFGFDGERKRWGTDGEKGVGLGLNLVREFVELNKGKVTVTSKESQGSCFRVYFPLFVEE
ncbi:ATP-binding protein [Reichenbachiella sp. MSK19-1]|uniref:ATP-binding protein n=1 Tax=Reichenbachiella sp. MSK19-1 TaxID=1897631 RepID=UPI001314E65F|nr:ATP-binding protein [Reichenbachiella sp. MSK19-1]